LRIMLIYLQAYDACNTSKIWNPGQPVSVEFPAGDGNKKINRSLNQGAFSWYLIDKGLERKFTV